MLFHLAMIVLAVACWMVFIPYFRRERKREMAMDVERDFYTE